MVSKKTQNILMIVIVLIAIGVLVLGAMIFFKPQKALTENELLDCVYDDITVSNIKRCFGKFPPYVDKELVDIMLSNKAASFQDVSFCQKITKDDWKLACLAGAYQDKSYCAKIKDEFSKALCLGSLGEENACDVFSGEQRSDCLAYISKDPEKCFLLPEYEQEFCFALRKKDISLCKSLPMYYEQIRCLVEIDPIYISKLEDYYIFKNFIEVAVNNKRTETCKYVQDPEFKKICENMFVLIV